MKKWTVVLFSLLLARTAAAQTGLSGHVQAGGKAVSGSTVTLYAAGAAAPAKLGVAQADRTSASVAKFAIVGVCGPFSGSWMTPPQPPDERSTKLGTLPAAILSPSAGPFSTSPSRNCAFVQTEATVVNSLIVTLCGGFAPSAARKASSGVLARSGLASGVPPRATR